MNLVFFNIGWMKSYTNGEQDILGNFAFLTKQKNKKNKLAHEKWNFLSYNGKCYAYVPIRWATDDKPPCINLERIFQRGINNDTLNNVTIVFISKNPENKITYIVGWYKNATLFRQLQVRPVPKGVSDTIYIAGFAKENDVVCLPLYARIFEVPTAQKEGKGKGYGRYPVWYADTKEIQGYRKEVWQYIENFSLEKTAEQIYYSEFEQKNKSIDPEYNKKIERIAIDTVIKYYKKEGYEVKSVEKENLGYDLEVIKNDKIYFVEVKGNAANKTLIRLSPNEFKMLRANYLNYIVASVINCDNKPILNFYTIQKKNIMAKEKYYLQHTENTIEPQEFIEVSCAIASF